MWKMLQQSSLPDIHKNVNRCIVLSKKKKKGKLLRESEILLVGSIQNFLRHGKHLGITARYVFFCIANSYDLDRF